MKKMYFVHIPKTAGNSVRAGLNNLGLLTNPGREKKEREHHFAKKKVFRVKDSHLSFKTPYFPSYSDKIEYKNADITFSVIRNPYDLLTSYYSHYIDSSKKKNWIDRGWANVNGYHGFKSFEEFIKFYCNEPSEKWHIPNLSNNLFCQLYDEFNIPAVDYVVYYDHLEQNLSSFLNDVLGINKKVLLPKKNVSPKKKKDYTSFYNEELKNLVTHKCKKQLLDFDFEYGRKQAVPWMKINNAKRK